MTSPSFSPDSRAGYVAIVGWPNVGKSSLLNKILGTKLSIVSPLPQTTRDSILGILNEPNVQMVFCDLPGWLKPTDQLQSHMRKVILRTLNEEADLVLWVIDAIQLQKDTSEFLTLLANVNKPIYVAFNKMDAVKDRNHAKAFSETLQKSLPAGSTYHYVSARTGEGVQELKHAMLKNLPLSPPYFPTDQVTDRWERFYVAELIREVLFQMFREEVPHASWIQVVDFREKEGRKDVIEVKIFTETDGQKKILIGKGGQMIRTLGEKSRIEIERQLGRPVFLELRVEVKKNWRKNPQFLEQFEHKR